jgi:hypothetical protein
LQIIKVWLNSSGLEGVIVKLLDENSQPVGNVEDQLTDAQGEYVFNDLSEGIYKVVIVEPVGYHSDENPIETILEAGGSNTVDFILNEGVLSISDTFDGTIIDDCKWDIATSNGATISQNNRLILSISGDYITSLTAIGTHYQFLNDFDVQVDFEIGEGWTNPISGHIVGAQMGVYINGSVYHISRIRFPTSGSWPPEGKDQLWLWKNTSPYELVRLNSTELSGKFRIIRVGSTLYFKYDFGSGWQDLRSVIASNQPVNIFQQSYSNDVAHAFTSYYDNFIVNSGTTTFSPCNAPPIADPNGPYLGAAGSPIVFDGTGSSDPDGDPLNYDWDFGDTYTGSGAAPSHTYTDAGIYDLCLTVDDGDVTSNTICTIVVVYDPSDGFVTGGGWIDSPEGAYVPDPTLTGRANFGFVSKYKKGATEPTGQTEFQFQTADLNFHSDSYEWLVVTGSNYARFKGEGTINAEGYYKFMIWTGDNEPDTFRIKIWTEDDAGVETVVYDNGFDQAIGGGSIVIHEKK